MSYTKPIVKSRYLRQIATWAYILLRFSWSIYSLIMEKIWSQKLLSPSRGSIVNRACRIPEILNLTSSSQN
jgi:hypothetical protein